MLTVTVRTPSIECEYCKKPQQHVSKHEPLLPLPYSLPANSLIPQGTNQAVHNPPTAVALHAEYAQPLLQPLPDARSPDDDDHHTARLLPSIASLIASPPAPSLFHNAQPSLRPRSEKDKMLLGRPFLPYPAQLVDERVSSSQASFSFNTAVQKDSGERAWLFRQIVTAGWIYPRAGERQVTGHLGHGINVSAPFYCEYGYNLSIGDNAVIGPDCQLLDSGRIAMGRNTKIGARVTISTLEEPTDTRPLEGIERTGTAREVYIGENVYIGDGCIIRGGARIGDNAIVRAGSVVVEASKPLPYPFLGLH